MARLSTWGCAALLLFLGLASQAAAGRALQAAEEAEAADVVIVGVRL